MTRNKFIRIMNAAISKSLTSRDGGYTCNILSLQESDDHNKETKLRKKYSNLFNFDYMSVFSDLCNRNDSRVVRINCLELFKIVMLESKGYEEL